MALAPGLRHGTASAFPGIGSPGQVSAWRGRSRPALRLLTPLVTLGWEGVQAPWGLRAFTRGHWVPLLPQKGLSPDCRKVTEACSGPAPGVPRGMKQEIGSQGKVERWQAPEPGGRGLCRRREPWARGGVADTVICG